MQSAGTSPSTADLLPTPTRVSRESVRRVADKGQAPTDAPVALPTANNPQLRTPTEQYIAAIWQEVLQTDNVAPEDNFSRARRPVVTGRKGLVESSKRF